MLDATTTFDSGRLDEDRWETPGEWLRWAVPTRGVTPPRGVTPSPTASADYADLLAAHRDRVVETLEQTALHGDAVLARAGQEALADPAACSPLGAAVVTYALEKHAPSRNSAADAWVAERGPAFAAEAAAWHASFTGQWFWDNTARRRVAWLEQLPLDRLDGYWSVSTPVIEMRAHLAELPEAEYRAIVARLEVLRNTPGGLAIRLATSYLAPTEEVWAHQDAAEAAGYSGSRHRFSALTASALPLADLETLTAALSPEDFDLAGSPDAHLLVALLRFGPDCAPALERMLRHRGNSGHTAAGLARFVSRFPTDSAFSAVLSQIGHREVVPVVIEAAQRFPRRALRLLGAQAGTSPLIRQILRGLAHAHPDLFAQLPPDVAYADGRRTAAPDEVPEILRNPPWQRVRTAGRQLTVANLTPPSTPALVWLPGEREDWLNIRVRVWDGYASDWEKHLTKEVRTNTRYGGELSRLFAAAPEELVRPHLATVTSGRAWHDEGALRRILARFDAEGLPYVLRAVQTDPIQLSAILLPAVGTPVTQAMTRWLDGRKTRADALAWFERNLAAALPDLIAAALAKPGKDRRLAENALRLLAQRGRSAEIESAAAAFDSPVAAAITSVLDTDPLHVLPAKIAKLPDWLVPELLPTLALRDRDTVLPAAATREVCTMLSMCGPNGDYAGIAHLVEATDPASLAEFGWALMELWRLAGYPSKDGWVLHVQGLVGNDDTARRLGTLIRVWPGESGHARAVSGLGVLTALGTDLALMQLHGIAEKVKFKALKSKAQEKVAEVAAGLGLTPEQLSDRLVPEFGLDADGSLVLDYGPRGFIVSFDEQLKPTVSDAMRAEDGVWRLGTARKALPKPGAKDDPELAPAAYKTFSTLKKEVKSAAADQIRRFEQAMVTARRWTAAEHRRLFVEHPLVWHLSRRLVWIIEEGGIVTGSFRIAEDRTYTDAADDPRTVADDSVIGLAHPLHLTDSLTAWGELFADYELLQPFPQLQRETYSFTAEERASDSLPRFQNLSVPTGRLLGFDRFGWERGPVWDGGVWAELVRPLGDGRSVVIDMDPGIYAGDAHDSPEQKISVRMAPTGHEYRLDRTEHTRTFAGIEAVTESELLRQLHQLVAGK
ncbi:DUF4132 domain-containing protein [Nocardia huaxiensis]|uniref:DUF4132 domain-containing protein n=1 Tax=Nocardia huaxiensis TaxID=2755382 RepID=UPI001E471F77|nr:DUF4132 domain-containing protein [Nocardia huaxiensis]UFS96978.1 DUF4132 domain-containing protein [Nocardia huaxiensis]